MMSSRGPSVDDAASPDPPFKMTAAWLVRPRSSPIAQGALIVEADGRIGWIGPALDAPSAESLPELHFPDGVITPGFVNTHTHLELSHLRHAVQAETFLGWLVAVRDLKEQTYREEFEAAASLGVLDQWSRGVTTVADTGSTGASPRALSRLGARGIYYHEVFGPDPSDADAAIVGLDAAMCALEEYQSEHVCIGVSPHAPYTVSDALARRVFARAADWGRPVAMHTAESPLELDFVRDGRGPFAAWHQMRQIPVAARGVSTIAWLHDIEALGAQPLCIHCVTVSPEDLVLLADSGASVAHCPLSNAAHGHGIAPLRPLREAGVPVGLGTDSAISQHPVDLRAEARATGLPSGERLALLTTEGARALAMETAVGDLQPGFWADLAVFDSGATPAGARASDWETGGVACTFIGGRLVYRSGVAVEARVSTWRRLTQRARHRLVGVEATD